MSSSLIVISSCSNLSTRFQKLSSWIDDGYDALIFTAVFRNCGVKVIIKISVNFVFL